MKGKYEMKIVNLKTFKTLPSGTIAMKYEPCILGRLFMKGEPSKCDFILTYLTDEIDCDSSTDFIDKLTLAENKGVSVAMSFEETMRDGLFEEKQLFAIWEKEDVLGLIDKLKECLEYAYNK
jgi:hypothetical protein